MDQINYFLGHRDRYWQHASGVEQTAIAVIVTIAVFYTLHFVLIRRLEKITALTNNDFDDRLVHFLKQFLWLVALLGGLIWILRINGIEVVPVLAGAGIF